ncbi:tRNA uridine(34) 5-carboxymethylaminomethyl modification radical SAM/GNAT enzyme Elp3 [candidate division WWE3 bacterium CG_4_9_14_0_2_um_filter_35_11]|uniref:tRNA carboxymethyluridine synthase n=1 Tax=candidate division WWE3 bacterium CG_4_9_14_0_2_um_filter_35_11 TaxID=1975077 RepID=A0A2M8EKQ6_UNCKA|nr:MAG: tRNA uridine(34) 5-carboxymethylaminomethyl modification radical SAM/GNAT enzyme Elp3 [candidate division WWE3 bacterium CG10_big_fil_rev_8_21_14_0_10_35_32]PJC23326.1 MAG: tRNA uridine(34) 5-carboxymethylaminomethyl modification radical SAM/GNAT enzyme Elp3 [candidate division WWE3 bacterium CG_4_9_14_0_2_um_filter_35_11]
MKKNNLKTIIDSLSKLNKPLEKDLFKLLHENTKDDGGLYSKSEILAEIEKLNNPLYKKLVQIIKMKSTRTISGVTPVTVLTKPFPCPGKCIFCPNDVRMPKSYLSDEPGAQRANRNNFDPYAQTFNRLLAYKNIGHPTNKVELIILGGTWTSYPIDYQIWFVKRCFDAMNDFKKANEDTYESKMDIPYEEKSLHEINGEKIVDSYNKVISKAIIPKKSQAKNETATWEELFAVQIQNENEKTRCIGLVIETRPDEITESEVIRIRKLGATKVQIGFQSLNDKVLEKNHRGHNVATTRNAVKLLRQAGFKIHAHWMPNLYGSNPDMDIGDFKKMFEDEDFMPDELKIYPCSLIQSAELMQYYKKGLWKPYTFEELSYVLEECYKLTPEYCRITRMIRDIGSQDIVVGNKKTNFRQIVEINLKKQKAEINEIRYREIRGEAIEADKLSVKTTKYETSTSTEYFLEYVTEKNKIAGFLRLSIPKIPNYIEELKNAAIIREVHVYGQSIKIGQKDEGKAQHLGLGKNLILLSKKLTKENGFDKLAVISSIGTREYYKKQGFEMKEIYQISEID